MKSTVVGRLAVMLQLFLAVHRHLLATAWTPHAKHEKGVYNYFSFGSNMLPSVMRNLRGIDATNATAAILPNYRLTFDAGPAAAAVCYSPGDCVHGVLYQGLTDRELAWIGITEGVPLAYQWERCHKIVPYQGDGECAGQSALSMAQQSEKNNRDGEDDVLMDRTIDTMAFTLTTFGGRRTNFQDDQQQRLQRRQFTRASRWYLNILREGASHWKLDRDYQIALARIATSK